MKWTLRVFLLFFIGLSAIQAVAQKTIVSGKVTDATTKEPLLFAPVFFVGTKSGAMTDENGEYRIETYYSSDSLRATSVGYNPITVKIKQGNNTVVKFELTLTGDLQEVIIRPEEGPNLAIVLVKNILRNKKINNREKLDAYEYEVY